MRIAPETEIKALSAQIRERILEITSAARSSHVGSSFSTVELLATLYSGALRYGPGIEDDPGRDRFILSKGHAVAALYSVLEWRGILPENALDTFYGDDTIMAGHATSSVPGVEWSTGSLGHGLSVGCGIAMGARLDGLDSRIWVMLSDGECDEGSVWEAGLFAAHHKLNNLVAIVDYNKVQSFGRVDEVLGLEPFADKWRAFGWEVAQIDGHDIGAIREQFLRAADMEAPFMIIADTVKGKGVSFMEDTVLWHYRTPQGEELADALKELRTEA
jgi:transketolase